MRALFAVVLVGCGAAPSQAVEAPPMEATSPARPASIEVGPPSAREPTIPAELHAAPPWVYRELSTGMIQKQSTMATYTLRRHGARALLTVERQNADGMSDVEAIKGWSPRSTKVYLGTVEVRGEAISITLSRGGEMLELSCEMGTIAAAAATAVRRPHPRAPGGDECYGDRGRWVPARTEKVEALRCGVSEMDDPTADRMEEMAFAAEPGVEFLAINDDCIMQGGGYRRIARDGSVANVR